MYAKVANGIGCVFNHEGIRIALVNFRYPICFLSLMLMLPHIKPALLFPGFLVSLFGESIQVWSLASIEKNRFLAVRGLYSLTRNPMYLGRFFLILGGVLLIGEIWFILVFLLLYYFYLVNRVKREEIRLHEIFQEEYESYCSMVNRFIPSFRQVNLKSLLYFKWSLFFENNAHWNLLGVLWIYLIFYFYVFINAFSQ